MDEALDRLVAEVLKSSKYAQIDPGVVTRIGAAELAKRRKFKQAVKATKNKLHQVGGAYLITSFEYESWLSELKQAESPDAFKQICWRVMGMHASTKERLPLLKDFYTQLFSHLPPVNSILDVACGLNPLAIPWMPLAPETSYSACDMYTDMVNFINAFMKLLPVDGRVKVCDVVTDPPTDAVDLALVLKAIPCLEQIDKQAGMHLLDRLNAHFIAISFPAKSLGGRSKGMVENYETHFEELITGRNWEVMAKLEFSTELVFVVSCGMQGS